MTSSESAGPGGQSHTGKLSSFALLTERAFLYGWLSGAATSTVRWLDLLAVGVYVFDRTGSPFQVALVTIVRMLPLALFGALAGALAEHFDRRRILYVAQVTMIATSVTLALLAVSGALEVWHLWVGGFLLGCFWVADFSCRRTMMAEAAGPERVGIAMSLESVTNNGTRMLGPTLGGLLLEWVGIEGAYWLSAVGYVLALVCTLRFPRFVRVEGAASVGLIASIVEGVRYLRGDRTVMGVLVVTLVFNLWAFPCVSMVPVIGKDELGLSAFPVGLLMSAEGAGAFCGALLLVGLAPLRWFRRLYVGGVALYLAMALGFSQSPVAVVAGGCLLVAGLGGAAFAAMQSTLVLMNSAPAVRARMMGLLSVFIGSGPIGFLHIGLMANLFGAPTAVLVCTLEGLSALLIVWRIWPELLQLQGISELTGKVAS
ncbi:MAG: MFS transporter [Gammaproteobacteria bacterium]